MAGAGARSKAIHSQTRPRGATSNMDSNETTIMDIEAIKQLLPHRYPFLLIDRVTELVPGERIVAVKNVSANEPFFQGHFPDYPVMPGVLIVEALAQAGAVMLLCKVDDRQQIPFLVAIERAKFRRQVVPGDRLRLETTVLHRRGGSCKLQGKAYVEDKLAAETVIMAILGPRS